VRLRSGVLSTQNPIACQRRRRSSGRAIPGQNPNRQKRNRPPRGTGTKVRSERDQAPPADRDRGGGKEERPRSSPGAAVARSPAARPGGAAPLARARPPDKDGERGTLPLCATARRSGIDPVGRSRPLAPPARGPSSSSAAGDITLLLSAPRAAAAAPRRGYGERGQLRLPADRDRGDGKAERPRSALNLWGRSPSQDCSSFFKAIGIREAREARLIHSSKARHPLVCYALTFPHRRPSLIRSSGQAQGMPGPIISVPASRNELGSGHGRDRRHRRFIGRRG
jgi:hypothetical protein